MVLQGQATDGLLSSAPMAASIYRLIRKAAGELQLDRDTLAATSGIDPERFLERYMPWEAMNGEFRDSAIRPTTRSPLEIAWFVQNHTTFAASPASLGVALTPLPAEIAETIGIDAAGAPVVSIVKPGSVADMAGFLPGDVILAVGGKQVDVAGLQAATKAAHAGETIAFTVLRNAERMEIAATF